MPLYAVGRRHWSEGKKRSEGDEDGWQPPIHPPHGTQEHPKKEGSRFYNLRRMRSARSLLLIASVVGVCLLVSADAGAAQAREKAGPIVTTDGRLRPGHIEAIRVKGFPGKGSTEVSIFPTAICEDECGTRVIPGGRTDAEGTATLRVRVPGTFFDWRDRPVYFRDGERIEVHVTWEGPGRSFAFGSAEPILVRANGANRG
ncbi:MAG TPA: hypothetical protein VFY48_03140 [Solirubrobacterales bacterium]|nr:hypothetical protein [Solirubrobacterales bacterium]